MATKVPWARSIAFPARHREWPQSAQLRVPALGSEAAGVAPQRTFGGAWRNLWHVTGEPFDHTLIAAAQLDELRSGLRTKTET
jgi:hypothetical protein